jgi:nuclease S1
MILGPEGSADSARNSKDRPWAGSSATVDSGSFSSDLQERALALSWVIHLVGDLHQPLHASDRNDRGGNEFKVRYRNRATCSGGASEQHPVKVELHSVWDTCVVVELEAGAEPADFADALRGALTTWRGHPGAAGDIMQWAKESMISRRP